MQIEIAAGLEPSTTAKAAYGRTEREGRGFFTPFAYRDNPKKLPLGCVILSPCRLSGRAREFTQPKTSICGHFCTGQTRRKYFAI